MTREQIAKRAAFMAEACARIGAAAESLERGEENPREVAQDIQRMAYAALVNTVPAGGWPFNPSKRLMNVARAITEFRASREGEIDVE